jgi:hypothetical protein
MFRRHWLASGERTGAGELAPGKIACPGNLRHEINVDRGMGEDYIQPAFREDCRLRAAPVSPPRIMENLTLEMDRSGGEMAS